MNEPAGRTGNDPIQDELVAYLDGELGEDDAARIEQRLADDAEYRRRLLSLQQAWDLLDELPRASLRESFTRSTVEMVALTAAGDVEKVRSAAWGRRTLAWFTAAVCVAASALVGYVAVTALANRPNEQLVRDLPVIENVDLYRNTENLDFIIELHNAGLFVEEGDDAL